MTPNQRIINLPLTYAPKIQGVIDGSIYQTIRAGNGVHVGDRIRFHGWAGIPYRSGWSFRTKYFKVDNVINCRINFQGIWIGQKLIKWFEGEADVIAALDGIVPPTGEALWQVLQKYRRGRRTPLMREGGEYQIIRWVPE